MKHQTPSCPVVTVAPPDGWSCLVATMIYIYTVYVDSCIILIIMHIHNMYAMLPAEFVTFSVTAATVRHHHDVSSLLVATDGLNTNWQQDILTCFDESESQPSIHSGSTHKFLFT